MIKITSTDLNQKQNLLVSGGNIKTINGESLLGTGDIVISGGASPPAPAVTAFYIKNGNFFLLPFSTTLGKVSSYTSFGEAIPMAGNVSVTSSALVDLLIDSSTEEMRLENITTINRLVVDTGGIFKLVALEVEAINGSFLIETTCTLLSDIVFPMLKVIGGVLRISIPSSISFPELLSVDKLRISVAGVHYATPKLKYITGDCSLSDIGTFDGSVLEQVGDYNDTSGLSPSRVYPALTRVNGNLYYVGDVSVFDAPLLQLVGNDMVVTITGGTVFSFPNLQIVGSSLYLACNGVAGLANIDLPELRACRGDIELDNCDNLQALVIGTIGVTKSLQNITIGDTLLTTVSLDRLLALLVSLDGTNGTTLWGIGKTLSMNSIAQAPSATGLANKVILEGRGATISI